MNSVTTVGLLEFFNGNATAILVPQGSEDAFSSFVGDSKGHQDLLSMFHHRTGVEVEVEGAEGQVHYGLVFMSSPMNLLAKSNCVFFIPSNGSTQVTRNDGVTLCALAQTMIKAARLKALAAEIAEEEKAIKAKRDMIAELEG